MAPAGIISWWSVMHVVPDLARELLVVRPSSVILLFRLSAALLNVEEDTESCLKTLAQNRPIQKSQGSFSIALGVTKFC